MASLFSHPPFVSLPKRRGNYYTTNCVSPQSEPPPPSDQNLSSNSVEKQIKPRTAAESTDWIASTLTRRFGIGAGLAWVGFLAVGVVSEQIKTRLEVSREEATTRDVDKEVEVVLPNGIRYYELRVGGGSSPQTGDLVVMNVKGRVQGSGEVFVDTFENRAIALVLGSKPYGRGICQGLEYALRDMKGGGKRRVIVPPNLGFGEEGADLGGGVQIPPSATLEYVVELQKVSIAPA
ncbi:hypothetical protein SASPL_149830 [Salvia splendens]|uniref:peptidylprolyl isomerase n=1 Tax=Salvia splendens TaxID=180675 RepID=A0A8X8W5E6_SALSN|nr:peptidyl-prolyl cis-trans isomerase FKBP17-2, chloroplastic-like [Salvia splendens]KAG6388405.1 hypothetical protein SASPL_149830 [Salvia splendens]